MRLNIVGYISFFISFSLLVVLSYQINDYSIILSWVFGVTIFFLFKKRFSKELFLFSFSVNTLFAVLLCLENYHNTGVLHSLFLDDKEFYETTISLVQADISEYFKLNRLSIFYFFTTKIYQFLEFFGVNSKSYFHYLLYNIILGSFVPVLIFSLGKNIFNNERTKLKAAYFVSVFPSLVYFNSIALRDVWVTFAFTLFIVLYLKQTEKRVVKNIGLLFTFVFIFILRHQSVFYPILFIFIYEFFKSNNVKIRQYIFSVAVFLLICCVIFYFPTIKEYYLWYKDYSYEVNASNSLGIKLKYELGYLGKFFYSIFYVLGPFPPLLMFSKITVSNILLDAGTVLWYFIVPFYFYSFIKGKKNTFKISFFLVFIITCIILSHYAGHLRHKTVFYPLILALTFVDMMKMSIKQRFNIFKKVSIVYLFLGLIYIVIKF